MTRAIRSYSVGQRFSIVLALAAQPELWVLDEPVASLDPLARAQFLHEMWSLMADGRCALLISSHIVGDLQALVNRIWLVDRDRMRWQGAIQDIGALLPACGDAALDLEQVFRQVVG